MSLSSVEMFIEDLKAFQLIKQIHKPSSKPNKTTIFDNFLENKGRISNNEVADISNSQLEVVYLDSNTIQTFAPRTNEATNNHQIENNHTLRDDTDS